MPLATIRTRSSSGRGSVSSTCSMLNWPNRSRATAAVICMEAVLSLARASARHYAPSLAACAPASPLAQHARKQVLGAAKPGFRQPDVRRIVLRPFLLGRTAGVIADDPVDLTVEHG